MHTRGHLGIRGYFSAALIASLAMAVTGVSGATALDAAASGRPIASFSQGGNIHAWNKGCKGCAWSDGAPGVRSDNARGAALARPTLTAMTVPASFEFGSLGAAASSLNSTAASTDVLGILATDIVPVSANSATSPPVQFAGTVTTSLRSRTTWRSNSFSIAGSRIWSKIIKFSSTGVNVRLPLN